MDSAATAARELRIVVGRLRRRLKEVADTHELTPTQMSVVGRLSQGGPASAGDLATAERVRPQSMAATVAALEERGFVARTPDPDDGRRRVVALTPLGWTLLEANRAERDEWLVRALHERYTEPERRRIVEALALLERLVEP